MTSPLENIDAVLFDCDGVVYQGDELLPGALDTLTAIKARGIATRFVTNTSARSVEAMHAKFVRLGLRGVVEVGECFHSGIAAAQYLVERGVRRVYVIGGSGLTVELERVGIECEGGQADNAKVMTDADFVHIASTHIPVEAVVVGYDTNLTFFKIAMATICFQTNPNCLFIATNDDANDRLGGQWLIPGNGPAVAALTSALHALPGVRHPDPVIVGKPNPIFGSLVLRTSNLGSLDPARVLFVGDKIETDIRLAKRCGFRSCLLLSGCATAADAAACAPEDKPDFVLPGISELV